MILRWKKERDAWDPKVGQWVRFYSGGYLVIGVIEYLSSSIVNSVDICTNVGKVNKESVLEYRDP